MNIKTLGINEEEFNAASDAEKLTWSRNNVIANKALCPSAEKYMEERCAHLQILDSPVLQVNQPPVNRLWFDPKTKDVQQAPSDMWTKLGYVEITEDFARYVLDKPDCECELREVEDGEDYYSIKTKRWSVCEGTIILPKDQHTLRWCKPRKPEFGWVECDVLAAHGRYGFSLNRNIHELREVYGMIGFGGIKFKDSKLWLMSPHFVDKNGELFEFTDNDDDKPATPVKVRFWQEVTK